MKKRDFGWLVSLPFYAVHVAAVVGVALVGWSWKGAALAVALYYVRMFGVTGGYHRYFSHRTYRTSRVFQFLLAVFVYDEPVAGLHFAAFVPIWIGLILFSVDLWVTSRPRVVPYPSLRARNR